MALVIVIIVATVMLFVLRAIRRQFLSPKIHCKLQCKCGNIEGTITAIRQDSIRINCYCQDCRDYATFVASLGNHPETTIGVPCGDSRVVQVCKSAVHIHKGREHLRLARKARPDSKSKKKGQIYMHRYYAGCCHVPLMNTVDFLGFVGIFRDFLDGEQRHFSGPVSMFVDEALAQPEKPVDISVMDFLWKLIRYYPWRKSGQFDYDIEPVYWGRDKEE